MLTPRQGKPKELHDFGTNAEHEQRRHIQQGKSALSEFHLGMTRMSIDWELPPFLCGSANSLDGRRLAVGHPWRLRPPFPRRSPTCLFGPSPYNPCPGHHLPSLPQTHPHLSSCGLFSGTHVQCHLGSLNLSSQFSAAVTLLILGTM